MPTDQMDSGEARRLRTEEIVREHAKAHDLLDGHGVGRFDDDTGTHQPLTLSERIRLLESRLVNQGGEPDRAEKESDTHGE